MCKRLVPFAALVLLTALLAGSTTGTLAQSPVTPRSVPTGPGTLNPNGHTHIFPSRNSPIVAAARAAHPFTGPCGPVAPFCAPPLVYHGGPLMASASVYAIFWLPPGCHYEAPGPYPLAPPCAGTGGPTAADLSYENLVRRWLGDFGGSSDYGVLTQYGGSGQPIGNASNLAGAVVDSTAYNAVGGHHAGTSADPLLDSDIQAEVNAQIGAQGWTANTHSIFIVYTGLDVESCMDATQTFCSSTDTVGVGQYCAYHGIETSGNDAIYANEADISGAGCFIGSTANNDTFADNIMNTTMHETSKSATDPDTVSGWHDGDGNEIADMCAYVEGPLIAGADAVFNGHPYAVQELWSNEASPPGGACALALGPLPIGFIYVAGSAHVGVGPQSVAVGQFTASGHQDLAVANPSDNTVSILLHTRLTKSCLPPNPPAGSGIVCTITQPASLPAGSTAGDNVFGPAGATITACANPSGGFVCGAPAAGPNNAVAATCGVSGCTGGDSFEVTVSSPAAGPLAETATIAQPYLVPQLSFPLSGATFGPASPPATPNGPINAASPPATPNGLISSNSASGVNPTVSNAGVTVSATGSGTVTVGQYAGDPGPTPTFTSNGNFFGVKIAPGNSFTQFTITLCGLTAINGQATALLVASSRAHPETVTVTASLGVLVPPSFACLVAPYLPSGFGSTPTAAGYYAPVSGAGLPGVTGCGTASPLGTMGLATAFNAAGVGLTGIVTLPNVTSAATTVQIGA